MTRCVDVTVVIVIAICSFPVVRWFKRSKVVRVARHRGNVRTYVEMYVGSLCIFVKKGMRKNFARKLPQSLILFLWWHSPRAG